MRIALLADIHGNLAALEAVLDELEGEDVDRVVCLGDVAVGPQPMETLERIRGLGCPVVMGNWDAWFLDGFPDPADELTRRLVEIGSWWAAELDDGSRSYMRTFERVVDLELDDGARLTAFHGSPRSFDEGILATTPDEVVEEMLRGVRAPVLVCGHTHFQLLRRVGESLLVNPGSVGLPFRRGGGVMHMAPWAEYAVATVAPDRLGIDFRRTGYDVESLAEGIRRSGMPHAGWWADLWAAPQAAPLGPA